MNLQIRDPDVRRNAERLALIENKTLTKAVGDALEFRLKAVEKKPDLEKIAAEIRAELKAMAGANPREMTKDEIDDMWGQ